MADKHTYSFFGKLAALFVNANADDLFLYFKFIKVKGNGAWERPSEGEGKSFKFSLEEMIVMQKVFMKQKLEWKTFHSFKENKTSISVKWEDQKAQVLWINAGDRSKSLTPIQVEVMRMLFDHLISEKIEKATVYKKKES